MAVRARFYVASVTKHANGAGDDQHGQVVMQAVTRKTDDNVQWAKYTPSGNLTMSINSEALAVFDALLGKDVSLLIEAATD